MKEFKHLTDEEIDKAEETLKKQYEERLLDEEIFFQTQADILNIDIDKYERKEAKKEAEKITNYYAYDRWKSLFNKVSFYNDVPCQILFHVLLGQLLSKKKIQQTYDYIDYRVHMAWVQDSGCLDEDTKIRINNKILKLKDLPKVFKIKGYNFQKEQIEEHNAIKIASGEKELYEIKLKDGKKVRASAEHIFFVKRNDKVIELPLSDIKIGDEILIRKVFSRKGNIGKQNSEEVKKTISKKAIERWNNEKWREKELYNRRKILKENYKLRGSKCRGKKRIFCKDGNRTLELKKQYSLYMKNNNPMNNLNIVQKLRVPNKKKGHLGVLNPSYGIPRYPKKIFVKEVGYKVRSSWEKECILKLLENNIDFKYESKIFKLSKTTYTPDFEVIPGKLYLEVKGPIFDKQIEKYKEVINNYDINLIFLCKDEKTINKLEKMSFKVYNLNDKEWIKICQKSLNL